MIEADPMLGPVLANYPSDRMRLLIPAVIVVGVVAVILNFTVAEIEGWGPPLTILIMGAVSLAAGWWVLHFWNREVTLYEKGFTYREGALDVQFLYAEIASMRQRAEQLAYFGGLFRRVRYHYTLKTIRGEIMTLDNLYRHVDKLAEQIEQKLVAELEPYLAGKIARGESIPFSDTLRLSSTGLLEGSRELAWEQFGGYKTGGGHMTLLASDGSEWFSLPLPEIDNIPILIHFLREHTQ
jgi:Family of unknown function (DUF6585)